MAWMHPALLTSVPQLLVPVTNAFSPHEIILLTVCKEIINVIYI